MTPQEFANRITKGEIPTLVSFIGEELFWAEEGMRAVEKRLFAPGEETFGKVVRSAHGLEPQDMVVEMATSAFFGGNRLLILKDIEKVTAALEEGILKGLGQLADGTHMIIQGEKLDKRRSFGKALVEKFMMVECLPMKPYQAQEWAVQEGRRQGIALEPKIARLLVERKGVAPGLLRGELEKIALYMDGNPRISQEEWEALIGGSTETDIFGLLDGVAQGQTGRALTLLEQLLRMGEPEMRILYMIGKQLHQLVWAAQLQTCGGNAKMLQQELGCHPYVAEKTWDQAKSFSLPRLAQAVERIAQGEQNIKTGRREPKWELEMTVVDLTREF